MNPQSLTDLQVLEAALHLIRERYHVPVRLSDSRDPDLRSLETSGISDGGTQKFLASGEQLIEVFLHLGSALYPYREELVSLLHRQGLHATYEIGGYISVWPKRAGWKRYTPEQFSQLWKGHQQ